jgi:DNA-binding MarR family transcriptional regulator
VNRLAAQELVIRKSSTEDRRQVFIALTPRGDELLRELTVAHKEELRRIRVTLQELLDRLQ